MEHSKHQGLLIGWSIEDITPVGPVLLFGQYYERLSEYVQSPLKATVCAIEQIDENGNTEQAVMASLDVLWILRSVQDAVKKNVAALLPELDTRKLFLNATHTHSAPNLEAESAFGRLVIEKLTGAIIVAWKNRKPAGISHALGYAVVGHNRRVQYSDGTTEMYGRVDRDDFIGLEGPTEPGVDMLFCWDMNRGLTGVIMNVSCPAQVTESKYYVSADYWSEVRKQVNKKFSNDIFILGQCGAAGDISPRDLPQNYKGGEPDMWDVPGIVEIGKRLSSVFDDAYQVAKERIETNIVFKHLVRDLDLPARKITQQEYNKALNIVREIRSREPQDENSPESAWNRFLVQIRESEQKIQHGPWDDKNSDFGVLRIHEALMDQYHEQDKKPVYKIELHVLRIGNVAFATNPFELFADYGLRITGRSKAIQTFIVQLCCDDGRYLPTEKAIQGGGYSALISPVGHEGGQLLVNETVMLINSLWE